MPFANNTFKKINQVNPLSKNFNFGKDSAGDRVAEVMSVFKTFQEKNYSWIIGAGNGFTYERNYGLFTDKRILHNVHFTPLALTSRYGVVISGIFFLIVFRYLYWIINIYGTSSALIRPLLFYQIFGFIASLFSYSIAADFILWVTMGLIFSHQKVLNKNIL